MLVTGYLLLTNLVMLGGLQLPSRQDNPKQPSFPLYSARLLVQIGFTLFREAVSPVDSTPSSCPLSAVY
jgi:hypothetical protein